MLDPDDINRAAALLYTDAVDASARMDGEESTTLSLLVIAIGIALAEQLRGVGPLRTIAIAQSARTVGTMVGVAAGYQLNMREEARR
jgi:hypothetical protein